MYKTVNDRFIMNILLGSGLVLHAVDCFKHFNRYVKDGLLERNGNREGILGSVAWYEAMDNDPQRYSLQLDSSNVEPTVMGDPRCTDIPSPLQPTPSLCEDLIPPDVNVTLGNPPLPTQAGRIWVKPSWLHLKSMLLEVAPVKSYTFHGYVLQIRYNNTPIGRFRLGGTRLTRGVQCPGGGPNNTVYYYRDMFFIARSIEWVPPEWFKGNVHNGTIHMTVIHGLGEYWKLEFPTRFFPYYDMLANRETYIANRQYFRTFLPKFFSWFTQKIVFRKNATIPPFTFRPRIRKVHQPSWYEHQTQFPNNSGFPF